MNNEKIQIGIYKINLDNPLFIEGDASEKLTNQIKSKNPSYSPQELSNDTYGEYKLSLLYSRNPTNPKWKNFFSSIASVSQPIKERDKSWAESFVLLVENIQNHNLFAITGGLTGYISVQEFVEDDFGVEVLSRLIKKEDKILKSVKEKSVMGGILGSTKFFRSNYNLFENDGFGKIYQELQASLNKDLLTTHFGFSINELKKGTVCVAKTSFKINKSITLGQILKLISGCEYVLENLDPITINSVTKIVKKRNIELVNKLEAELFHQLWLRYNEGHFIDFDICHKDFENYLTANEYIVRKGASKNNLFDDEFESMDNVDILFNRIKQLDSPPISEEQLKTLLQALKIYSYGEDQETELTGGWLVSHLFGDVQYENKKYFLIDNSWFEIASSFVNELDQSCSRLIKDHSDNQKLEKKWAATNQDEDKYNETYFGETNTLVVHKITPENIEVGDIIKWDDTSIFLCHIKEGFGNTMRSLCSQIFISANRILNDINNDRSYIGTFYDQIASKKNSNNEYFKKVGAQSDVISKVQFLDLFNNRKLVYILAVTDTAGHNRALAKDIGEFKSSIAKFSLQELAKDMRGLDVDFRICQIEREI